MLMTCGAIYQDIANKWEIVTVHKSWAKANNAESTISTREIEIEHTVTHNNLEHPQNMKALTYQEIW